MNETLAIPRTCDRCERRPRWLVLEGDAVAFACTVHRDNPWVDSDDEAGYDPAGLKP